VANNSLIVPGDVVHFSLAYLALVFVPGYAMAVLARPRSDWIEPGLRLVYASAAGCRQADRAGTRCPSTGSYVFAIEDNGQPLGG
jgi:hypothetical protein